MAAFSDVAELGDGYTIVHQYTIFEYGDQKSLKPDCLSQNPGSPISSVCDLRKITWLFQVSTPHL